MKKFLASLFACIFLAGTAFAQEAGAVGGRDQGGFSQTLIMVGIALFFFYFILWRPEKKRRKQSEQLRSNLKKGDRITAMGIIGTVHRVEEATVIVKMYDGSKIEFLKAAISDVSPATGHDKDPILQDKEDSKQVDLVQST